MRHNRVTVLAANTFLPLGNSLLVLSFDGNGLEFIYSRAFNGLTRLKSLSLADNSMTFLPGDTFTKMLNLSVLILRRANLSSLFSRLFERLACLERIDLSANSITNLSVGLLRNSPQLRAVDMSDNDLRTLSSCTLSETRSRLTALSLVGNINLQCDCRLTWLVSFSLCFISCIQASVRSC